MLEKIVTAISFVLGIIIVAVLFVFLYSIIMEYPSSKRVAAETTIRSDESDFVTESRLQEKLNSAEVDKQVALFNLQSHVAKRFFTESGPIYIMTPVSLVLGTRSKPGKLSPEMQK